MLVLQLLVAQAAQAAARAPAGSAASAVTISSPQVVESAQAGNLPPQFSFATMGGMVFMQLCNPNATVATAGYPATVMATLAKYPLVTFEKCVGTSTAGYEEDKVAASCAALKKLNPELSCVFYLNTELDFSGYRLFDQFEQRPEFWLLGPGGGPVLQRAPQWGCRGGVCPGNGTLKLPDYSVPAAAEFWLSACANMTAHPAVDGCNLDRSSHVGSFTALPAADWSPRNGAAAFNAGKLRAFQRLQQVVGQGPVIANCHSCLEANTTIPGVHSQNIEGFGPSEQRIVQLQVLAKAGKLAKAHYSVGGAGAGCLDPAVVEHAMAAFLIGAGENAFFSCAAGWTGRGPDGSIAPWVAWLPQYDRPLGTPVADGVKNSSTGVWTRSFRSGTKVFFDGHTARGQICWADTTDEAGVAPCPPFPPPRPPPPPPAPPAPASCGAIRRDTGVGGIGSDVHSLQKKVGTAAACCEWCEHNRYFHDPEYEGGCMFWAWHAEDGNACHLHTAAGQFSKKSGCFSGKLLNNTKLMAAVKTDDGGGGTCGPPRHRLPGSPYPASGTPSSLLLLDTAKLQFTAAQAKSTYALQGILAQTCPALWMLGDPASDYWLPRLEAAAGIQLDRAALHGNWSFNETLAHFAASALLPAKTYSLFDAGEASETAAYTVAAAVGALPISLADEPLARANGLTLLHDLRGETNAAVIDLYAKQLATDFANLHAPTAGPQQVDLGVYGRGVAIMDQDLNNYPVTTRVHSKDGTFADRAVELVVGKPNALTEKILKRMGNESAVFGWLGSEHPLVKWLGEHGGMTHCSGGNPNLSTLMNIAIGGASFTQTSLQRHHHGPKATPLPKNVGTHTISFIMSDGDSVAYSVEVLPQKKWFGSPSRGRVPLGWTLGPAHCEICPLCVDEYYANATVNDSFIGGPSGMGYVYPDSYRSMSSFATKTAAFMKKSDMRIVNVIADVLDDNWTVPLLSQDQIDAVVYYNYSDYAGMCHPTPGLPMAAGCAPIQWVPVPGGGPPKPVLGGRMNLWSGVGPEPWGGKPGFENVSSLVAKLKNESLCPKDSTDPNGYSIIPVHVWTHTVADVAAVVAALGPGYSIVTPDDYLALVNHNLRPKTGLLKTDDGSASGAAPFSPATDAIVYNLGRTATPSTGRCPGGPCKLVTVNRTLTDRLAERISVLDFGASGGCRGETEDGCKVDSTPAFQNALTYAGGEDSTPETWQTVFVPPGYYRIDGTVTVGGQTLVLERGAILIRRKAITMSGAPLIRISGTNGRVSGSGQLLMENPSHRGIVNIGPQNLSVYDNVEYNILEGISIVGAGGGAAADCTDKTGDAPPLTCIGIAMDSSEPFVGGSCYENVVRDVRVSGVDAGVYMAKYVNANQLSGVMMGGIGRYGYLLVNNTENSVFGGFVTGGGNATTSKAVIAGRGSGYNWFVSVQAEPGGGSSYFDFDNRSEANAVIGHDNTPHGAASQDPAFLYQEGRSFHMGNFNSSSEGGAALGAEHCIDPVKGNEVPCLMQIEGSAYIRNVTAVGLRCALAKAGSPKVDLCEEVETLRQTVTTQEEQLHAQEARIGKLEEALRLLMADTTKP
jgi:hypothetical protein